MYLNDNDMKDIFFKIYYDVLNNNSMENILM